eukprot:6800050-Pyramimonas_sp.AAC.1
MIVGKRAPCCRSGLASPPAGREEVGLRDRPAVGHDARAQTLPGEVPSASPRAEPGVRMQAPLFDVHLMCILMSERKSRRAMMRCLPSPMELFL